MGSDLDRIARELRQAMRDYYLLTQKPRLKKEHLLMALDFTKLNASVALAQANATALKTQADASTEAADQAAIDSAQKALDAANAVTTSLLPAPEPEPAPVVEEQPPA